VLLLGLVSIWRVAVLSRIYSVVCRTRFVHALASILTAASIEMLVGIFVPMMEHGILAGMAGIRHSPAEEVRHAAMTSAWVGALITLPFALPTALLGRGSQPIQGFPPRSPDRLPWAWLVASALG